MRRENFNSYERLLTTDLNSISTEIYNTVLDRLVSNMSGGETGFVLGGGLVVSRNSSTELAVTAGEALVKRTTIPTGQGAYCTVGIAASTTVAVPVAHASLNRIDILVLNPTDTTMSSQTRDIRIGGADAVTPQTVAKVLEFFGAPLLVVGTPDASPVAPAVPTNCLLLSEIVVTAASGVVSNASIAEKAKRFELTRLNAQGTYLGDLDSATSGGVVNIGTTNASTINIGTGSGVSTINLGGAGDTVVIDGTLTTVNTTDLEVTDKNITLNKGGLASSGSESGISIEENASVTGYIRTSALRNEWSFKSPASSGKISFRTPSSVNTGILSADGILSDRIWVLPDTSGTVVTTGDTGSVSTAMIAGGAVTNSKITGPVTGSKIASASASVSGVVTTGTQSFSGFKTFTNGIVLNNEISQNQTSPSITFISYDSSGANQTNTSLTKTSAPGGQNEGLTLAGGKLSITDTTASTSPTTGALVVSGGLGVGGDTWIGGNVYSAGNYYRIGQGLPSDQTTGLGMRSVAGLGPSNAAVERFSGADGKLLIRNEGAGAFELQRSGTPHIIMDGNGTAVQGRVQSVGAGFIGQEIFESYGATVAVGPIFGNYEDGGFIMNMNITPGIWIVNWRLSVTRNGTGTLGGLASGVALNTAVTSQGTIAFNHYGPTRVGFSLISGCISADSAGSVVVTCTTGGSIQLRGYIVGNAFILGGTGMYGTYMVARRIA